MVISLCLSVILQTDKQTELLQFYSVLYNRFGLQLEYQQTKYYFYYLPSLKYHYDYLPLLKKKESLRETLLTTL